MPTNCCSANIELNIPIHSKGDQSWVFFGRNDAKAETPVLSPPHAKSWLIGKDPDAGRDWGQEEKGATEDEMAGWHHWLYGRGFGWTPGVGDGQGGLACCNSWGRKESDMTERLNWTELIAVYWVHSANHTSQCCSPAASKSMLLATSKASSSRGELGNQIKNQQGLGLSSMKNNEWESDEFWMFLFEATPGFLEDFLCGRSL